MISVTISEFEKSTAEGRDGHCPLVSTWLRRVFRCFSSFFLLPGSLFRPFGPFQSFDLFKERLPFLLSSSRIRRNRAQRFFAAGLRHAVLSAFKAPGFPPSNPVHIHTLSGQCASTPRPSDSYHGADYPHNSNVRDILPTPSRFYFMLFSSIAGPMVERCVITLTPITDKNGNPAVEEVRKCTLAFANPGPGGSGSTITTTTPQPSTTTRSAVTSTTSSGSSSAGGISANVCAELVLQQRTQPIHPPGHIYSDESPRIDSNPVGWGRQGQCMCPAFPFCGVIDVTYRAYPL